VEPATSRTTDGRDLPPTGVMPRRPWSSLDSMRSRTILQAVVPLAELGGLLDESSDSDSSLADLVSVRSNSLCDLEELSDFSSSSGESEAMDMWYLSTLYAEAGLVLAAAEPYCRDGITYAIGPDRYSFSRIEELWAASSKCKDMFRFELEHMRELLVVLRFPDTVRTPSRFAAPGEEALCILLRRMSYPGKWTDLCWEAGCSISRLCEVFQAAVDHVYETFDYLRDSRSLEAWVNHLERFAAAVHAGGVNGRGYRRPCPLTNCCLFVDGSVQEITRPSIFQQSFYNGHKKGHGVKWQGHMLPNGIMPMPYGPVLGRRHDSYMLERSRLVRVLRRMSRKLGRIYCGYGDPAYPQSLWLLGPFRHRMLNHAEAGFNTRMSATRIPNEWGFGKVRANWAYLDYHKGMRPYMNDLARYWPVANILTNCHTCCYGSQTSAYFQVEPPSLRAYVAMGSDMPDRGF
jgi:nuclease HARBI1